MSDEQDVTTSLQRTVSPIVARAHALEIRTPQDRADVSGFLKAVKVASAEVHARMDSAVETAHTAHKAAVALRKSFLGPLEEAERLAKIKAGKWDRDQAEAEKARVEIEQAKANAETERERQRLLKRADTVKTPELAETLREQAEAIVAPVVQIATPAKVAGESARVTWKARVVDVSLVPREYMIVNETALQAMARATNGAIRVPGVEFYAESSLAVRI